MSDAFNNGADTLALGVTYFALGKMEQEPTAEKTFGGKRWEIIAALMKGTFLVTVSLFIVYESVMRFLHPESINAQLVLLLASIALIVNLASVKLLSKGAENDLNLRSASLCMIYDAAASFAVIISACLGLIWPFAALSFDLLASSIIVVMMLRSGVSVVRQSLHILLQNTPEGIDFHAVAKEMQNIPGVLSVSDLHIWTLASGEHYLTSIVVLDKKEVCECEKVLQVIRENIKQKFQINHITLQPEYTDNEQPLLCSRVSASKAS